LRKGGRFRIVFGGAQGTDNEVQGTLELKKVPRGTEPHFPPDSLATSERSNAWLAWTVAASSTRAAPA
jgi:hypothetical protein